MMSCVGKNLLDEMAVVASTRLIGRLPGLN